MKAYERFLNALFPPDIYCICCGSVTDKTRPYSICDACIDKFHWPEGKTCSKCGKILDENYEGDLCTDCAFAERSFDKGYTCSQYGLYERAVIMDLKYRGKSWLGKKIGEIMADRMECEECRAELAVPVPLAGRRMKERGYNQAEIAAREMAKRLGIEADGRVLERVRETKAMKDLDRYERMENVRGAFRVAENKKEKVEGSKVLLVDDIYTTGSTIDAAAKALKDAGAARVDVITFAAGGNLRQNSITTAAWSVIERPSQLRAKGPT